MIRRFRLLPLLLLLALVPAATANAAPDVDHNEELAAGESFEWDGTVTVGTNINFHEWPYTEPTKDVIPPKSCSKNAHYYCDTLLFKFTNPLTAEEIEELKARGRPLRKSRTATITVDNYTFAGSDFDLRSFESDADGTQGPMITETGENPGTPEVMPITIVTTPEVPERWVLVHVGYFAAVGGYDGHASF